MFSSIHNRLLTYYRFVNSKYRGYPHIDRSVSFCAETPGPIKILAPRAVVTKDVPDCAIVGGNPAAVIGYRDRETFDKLKAEGKFFRRRPLNARFQDV